jgi:cytochrome c
MSQSSFAASRPSLLRRLALAGLFASLAANAQAADAAAGKAHFEDACGLCHSAAPGDELGGMGPNLYELKGKAAGTADKAFPYTAALKGSNLVWDAATLDRFLAAPTKVVPGTRMQVALPAQTARDDVVAYLLSVKPAAPAK